MYSGELSTLLIERPLIFSGLADARNSFFDDGTEPS
jgi:hypothetical protein